MKPSKVFFTDFHATSIETLPQKLHRLMKRAGFEEIDLTDRYAAVKIHFGELGNLAHLRPQYARVVTDYVRERGVSPFCDCHAENDIPIILDVGMLASFDPVALDQTCVDLCNKMPVCEGSRLDRHRKKLWDTDPNHEYFHLNHPDAEWEAGLIHAEEIGLGTRQYELIRMV